MDRVLGTGQTTAEPLADAGSPLTDALARRDGDMRAMVRAALERKDVLLAYQPVIDARRPERAAFFEALIRVIDDTGRIIPAFEFIDFVEAHETGRIIDCLALEFGLKALRLAPQLRLSVNMSARSIGYPRWMDVLRRGLSADPTIGERLIIEITEASAILMPDTTQVFMEDLQLRGIAFALDDFGAGYSSFKHLRDLDFDIVKISGDFVSGIAEDPDNQAMVSALLSIARHFDMFAVAEGVEREQDAELLQRLGVDCLQGFFFGVPSTKPTWKEFPEVLRQAI